MRRESGTHIRREILAGARADQQAHDLGAVHLGCHEQRGDAVLRVPFHVGEDRSRTWVITRLPEDGLRLKHDHRHEDGSEDVLTQYGGDTEGAAGPVRADFPADAESQALFEREGIPVSMANVWSITLSEDSFIYALDRPNRHFAVEFDLTEPVETPPAPWGAE